MSGNTPWQISNLDQELKTYLSKLVGSISQTLKTDLVGVYLHGSLAMGSYYKPKSDIDLIVVVETSLSSDRRKQVAQLLARIAELRPTIGNIEVSVLTRGAASNFSHPCPYEVYYSSDWHEKILQDEVDFSNNNTDSDLAAHLTYVKKRGIVLQGEAIESVFGAVPWSYCIDVPSEYHPIVQKALAVYRSTSSIDVNERRQGGVRWDRMQLLAFRDYAKEKVATLVRHL